MTMFRNNKQFRMIFTFTFFTANDTAYCGTDCADVYNNLMVQDEHIFLDYKKNTKHTAIPQEKC